MTHIESNDEGVYATMLAGLANKLPEATRHALSQMSAKDRKYAEQIIESGKIQLNRQK